MNCVRKLLLILLVVSVLAVAIPIVLVFLVVRKESECNESLESLLENSLEHDIFNASDVLLDYVSGYSDTTGNFDPCDDFAKFVCPYYRAKQFSGESPPTTIFQRHNIQSKSIFFDAFMHIGSQAVRGLLEPKYNWLGIVYDLYRACVAAAGNANERKMFDKEVMEQQQKISDIIFNAEDHTAFADLYHKAGIKFPFQLSYLKQPLGVRIYPRPIEPVVPYLIWFALFDNRLSLPEFKLLLKSQNIEFEAVNHVERKFAALAHAHGFGKKQEFADKAKPLVKLPKKQLNYFWNWPDYVHQIRPMDIPNDFEKILVGERLWDFANDIIAAVKQLLMHNRTDLAAYLNNFVWTKQYYPTNASACWESVLQNYPEAPVVALDRRYHCYTQQQARKLLDLSFKKSYNEIGLTRLPVYFDGVDSFGIAEKHLNGWCEVWNRRHISLTSSKQLLQTNYLKSAKFFFKLLTGTNNEQYSVLTTVARAYITSGAFIELGQANIHFGTPLLLPPRLNPFLNFPAQFGQTYSILGHEQAHRVYLALITANEKLPFANFNTASAFMHCLVQVYNQHSIAPGQFNVSLDGMGALKENFADILGLQLTLSTYKRHNETQSASNHSSVNFTNDQIFFLFLGMNQAFCREFQDDSSLVWQQLRDEHTVGANRLNILLQETPQFAEAFKCPLGSRMNPRKTGLSCFDTWMNALR